MRGPLYTVSYDGKTVALYVDINDSTWGVHVQSQGRERGFQSFAFHPQFGQAGTPGYGKFYTWSDSRNTEAPTDFKPGGGTFRFLESDDSSDDYDSAADQQTARERYRWYR